MVHLRHEPERSGGRSGRVLALALAVVALAFSAGNSFALHAGHRVDLLSAASSAQAPVEKPAALVIPSAADGTQRDVQGDNTLSRHASAPTTLGAGAWHVMHLVGACMAVLFAALLLLAALVGARRDRRWWFTQTTTAPPAAPTLGPWRPPPLSPPTSSPVIRT